MEIDMSSGFRNVEVCHQNSAKLQHDICLSLDSKRSRAGFLVKHMGVRLPQPFPPPPPPPTRESSVPPVEKWDTIKIGKNRRVCLEGSGIPRELPEVKPCSVLAGGTSFIRCSGIRETLPRIKKLEVTKQQHKPLADVILSSERFAGADHDPTLKPTFHDVGKKFEVKSPNEVKEHEQDAAHALLVLRQCSRHVTDMTRSWSQFHKVPLCDFIVAQKKCQMMLENIETLKDVRIQVREATAVEDTAEDFELTRHVITEKRRRMDLQRTRSKVMSSRSSSTVSIVNVIKREKGSENGTRCLSTSSECTATKSPTEASCQISQPAESQPTHHFVAMYGEPSSGSASSSDDLKKTLGKIGKTSKSGKNRNTHMKCLQCSATDTPEWRKGPVGPTTLCNACGLFYKKLLKRFGGDTAGVIMKIRQTKNPQDRKVPRSLTS